MSSQKAMIVFAYVFIGISALVIFVMANKIGKANSLSVAPNISGRQIQETQ